MKYGFIKTYSFEQLKIRFIKILIIGSLNTLINEKTHNTLLLKNEIDALNNKIYVLK